ncbi:hypothetical protein WJX72_006450 [[Myrmecia] bisecta]|uniref:1-phosphatidylinositol 4-kinase n=1 Tax=[Myrmecia] bisecta TaxID=41462 RepID=A0AAW1Q2V4_9CHLO
MALALGVSNNSGKASTPPLPPASGKTDLLLRFFDSQFFDEWIALTYLYKSNSPGVQDYLCNRLYSLPEDGVERYLSQLCQLLISRPYVSLERVLIDLCARSLRIAVKVYWLLLAISQDHPKNKYVADLRDKCERAALEGYWEPPFRDPKLLPLSPRGAIYSPPTSPTYCGNGRGMLSPSYHDRRMRPNNFDRFASPNARWGSPEPFTPPNAHRWASPDGTSRPTSPDGLGGGIFSSYTMGQGLEGLICASPSTVRLSRHSQSGSRGELSNGDTPAGHSDRVSKLRKELGEGEGVTALLEKSRRASEGVLQTSDEPEIMSPPSSPRLRQTTFGATLDFIEALCDASAGLTAFAQEDRQYALRRGLEEINKEIELASRHGVACWFPLGCRNERIVRLTAKEAVLLNSREKAPFILHIEVLRADAEEDEEGSAAPVREVPSDSARSLLGESAMGARLDSNAEAGPGPGSKAQQLSQPARLQHRRSDSAGEAEGHSRLPAGSASRGRVLGTRRSLSFPEAVSSAELDKLVFAMDMGSGQAGGSTGDPATKPALDYIADASAVVTAIQPGVTRSLHGSVSLPSYVADLKLMAGELQQLKVMAVPPALEDSFSRGLKTALAGLRGEGPLVTVRLQVLNDYPLAARHASAPGPLPPVTPSADEGGGRSDRRRSSLDSPQSPGRVGVTRVTTVTTAAESMLQSRGFGLLLKWGLCRRVGDDSTAGRGQAEPRVRLHLKVAGGVDLRLGPQRGSGSPKHRRVPGIDAARLASHATASTSAAAPPYTGIADAARVVREEREARRLQAQARAVFGERFQHKAARIKKESPHGRRPGWAVRSVIVKSGDDCRQELLAMQLIRTFHDIFQDAQLPLWLHPYEVLVTSNRTALIEMVPDSLSIHSVKAKSPPGMSLRNFFLAKFGKDTPELMAAQRNFAESMAGYSLVCYLLQIKDRHNGNILLDDAGHIIHIDFGFMLSNSPGGVNFEAAPFKLTRELLEVLNSNSEGKQSDLFDYYKVMCIQGFLACRKHADRVILLVEMMAGSGCPCFKAGARAVQNLRKRFHLGLTEAQCVEVVLGMISDSLDAWRTRQYDYYQRVLNGIL